MSVFLVAIYIILMLSNLYNSLKCKESIISEVLALLLLMVLMCGHLYVGDGDYTDLYFYERDYANILSGHNINEYPLYYLFWGSQVIAKLLGLSYHSWWMIMTAGSLFAVHKVFKDNRCNRNYCMFFFMVYAIAFYTGLKYYYGFCVLSIGIKYLLRDEKGDKLRFALFLLVASGFHPMYYLLFILFLIDLPIITPKTIFKITFVIFLGVVFFWRTSFTTFVSNMIAPLIREVGSSNITYFQDRTNRGIIIPVALHLITLFYAYKYKKIINTEQLEELKTNADRLLRANYILVLLYPSYLFAITFVRFNTVFSLITIFYSSIHYSSISYRRRKQLLFYGILVLISFGIYFFVIGLYFDYNFRLMFDLNVFRL